MIEILPLLACLAPVLTATTCKQMSRIALAMIAMSGRVTMLGRCRGQLSERTTLFRHGAAVGKPVLAVFSDAFVSERGGLPPGW
jgi:hypothetical protein